MKGHTIMHWNCKSINSNKVSLEHFLLLHEISICCLSETWLKSSKQFTIPNYNVIRTDRRDGKGGTAILIRNDIPYHEVDMSAHNNNHAQIAATDIFITNQYVRFISVYTNPNTIKADGWSKLVQGLTKPVFVLGDFNAHHTCWGNDTSDKPGFELLDFLDDNNLTLMNDGSPTFNRGPNFRETAIDLSICSPSLAQQCTWTVHNNTIGYDHFPILITISKNQSTDHSKFHPNSIWNVNRAEWNAYTSASERLAQNLSSANEEEEDYTNILELINCAAKEAIPLRKPKLSNQKSCPWWDDECDRAEKEKADAFKKYKNLSNIENYIKVRRTTAIARKLHKKKKRESWENFCSNLNRNTPSNIIWKQIKRINNKTITYKSKLNETETQHLMENILANNTPMGPDELLTPSTLAHHSNTMLTGNFQQKELEMAIRMNTNTSPGFDNVHYKMISQLSNGHNPERLGSANYQSDTKDTKEPNRTLIISTNCPHIVHQKNI